MSEELRKAMVEANMWKRMYLGLKKEVEQAEQRKDNYDGFVTIGKFIKEYNFDKYDKDLIYDALTWKGLNRNETIQTVYRRLPEAVDDYMGRTISGTKGTPIYPPAVISGVVKQYLAIIASD